LKTQRLVITISLVVVVIGIASNTGIKQALAYGDPIHCDRFGWPTCYSVGFQDGQANLGSSCPSSHSSNFCFGWNAGANTGDYGNNNRRTSDWGQGDADGKVAADNDFQSGTGMNLHCGFEHSTNYCLGFRTGYLVQWGVDALAHGGN
jgi:hypothetical protein